MRKDNVIFDALLRYNIPHVDDIDAFLTEVVQFINNDRNLHAIKAVKDEINFGLKESKDFVFALADLRKERLTYDLQDYLKAHGVAGKLTEQENQKNKFNEELL